AEHAALAVAGGHAGDEELVAVDPAVRPRARRGLWPLRAGRALHLHGYLLVPYFCALRNARSKPGSARTMVSRSTVSEMRMWPGMPKPEPGTVRTPSSASDRTKATSSSMGVCGNT